MTNFENLTKSTDTLALLIDSCQTDCELCPAFDYCQKTDDFDYCVVLIKRWLEQEVEEDENDT